MTGNEKSEIETCDTYDIFWSADKPIITWMVESEKGVSDILVDFEFGVDLPRWIYNGLP